MPTHSGVRYYDTTTLDGGHLLTMLTNAKEASPYIVSLAKNKNTLPAVSAILAPEWQHQKTLASREAYLIANVEPLLLDLFKEKHETILPVFVARKWESPPKALGPDGKPLKKPVFDTAKPSNDELNEIWAAIRKHSRDDVKDDALIQRCEKDWFHFGVNERTIQLRSSFMRGYMEDLGKRMPYAPPTQPQVPP